MQIEALILENTFTNLPRLVPKALPLLGPLSFLCHQKWDSASKIPLIPRSTPILMLSGVRDEVVPREHMQELWQIVSRRQGTKSSGTGNKSDITEVGNGKSRFLEFEGGHHSALFRWSDFCVLIMAFRWYVCPARVLDCSRWLCGEFESQWQPLTRGSILGDISSWLWAVFLPFLVFTYSFTNMHIHHYLLCHREESN